MPSRLRDLLLYLLFSAIVIGALAFRAAQR